MINKNTLKSNPYQSFFIKLTAFLFLTFCIDFAIGSILKTFYFKQKGGFEYGTEFAINKTTDDILILGSSRALSLYNPIIFQNSLHQSCYNAGRNGHPIFYHYALLKANLQRHTPKMVILSFDAGNFSINQDAYDRIGTLLPFYNDHPEIRSIVELKSPYEKLKMISSIYPYNSLILPIISGNTAYSKIKYANIKGYIGEEKEMEGPKVNFDYTTETKLDTVKINTYKAFLQLCIDNKVKVVVVCPPYFINATGVDKSTMIGKEIARKLNVNFLDYSKDSFYTNKPKLFYDYRHLNDKGVTIFSKSVVNKIINADTIETNN